jgi:lysophospholipid acyltransferase (LPLAT)-like uncharacterized protein
MKKISKLLIHNVVIRFILSWIAHLYIYIVFVSSKIIIKYDKSKFYTSISAGKSVVFFTWHNKILISPAIIRSIFPSKQKMFVLISTSGGGRLAGAISKTFNINTIKTFNTKKRVKNFEKLSQEKFNKKKNDINLKRGKIILVIRQIIRCLSEKGNILLVAADAPRGPSFKINAKIIPLVKKTNALISFAAISYKNKKVFKTWDKFELPLPFNTIICEFSDLYEVGDVDETAHELEQKINRIVLRNDFSLKK